MGTSEFVTGGVVKFTHSDGKVEHNIYSTGVTPGRASIWSVWAFPPLPGQSVDMEMRAYTSPTHVHESKLSMIEEMLKAPQIERTRADGTKVTEDWWTPEQTKVLTDALSRMTSPKTGAGQRQGRDPNRHADRIRVERPAVTATARTPGAPMASPGAQGATSDDLAAALKAAGGGGAKPKTPAKEAAQPAAAKPAEVKRSPVSAQK